MSRVSTTRVEWDILLYDTLYLHNALAKPFNCVVQTSQKEGRRPGFGVISVEAACSEWVWCDSRNGSQPLLTVTQQRYSMLCYWRPSNYMSLSIPWDFAASKCCVLLTVSLILSSSNISVVNKRFTLLLHVLLCVGWQVLYCSSHQLARPAERQNFIKLTKQQFRNCWLMCTMNLYSGRSHVRMKVCLATFLPYN